jgi:hypothetical protein
MAYIVSIGVLAHRFTGEIGIEELTGAVEELLQQEAQNRCGAWGNNYMHVL